ncbi:MAG: porin family protein [Prevotellaceae bacterium]|jgi:outer membrane protein X|nr:porin family protein [Prevotellaceae bacterium]
MTKKVMLLLLVSVISLSSFAQKGTMAVGVNLSYPMEFKTVGIGARFNYSFTDQIRISPALNYYVEKDGFSGLEITADVHYLFNVADKISVYPLVGLHYTTMKEKDNLGIEWGWDTDREDTYEGSSLSTIEIGFDIGGGVGYNLTDNFTLGLELKYSNLSQFVPMIYLTYKF